jgi:hypothetical protein
MIQDDRASAMRVEVEEGVVHEVVVCVEVREEDVERVEDTYPGTNALRPRC